MNNLSSSLNRARVKVKGDTMEKLYAKYDFKKMTKAEAEDGLTERDIKFCYEYLRCYNATQAALRAGYRKEVAHCRGSALLRKGRILKHLTWLKYRTQQECFYDAKELIFKLLAISNVDMNDYAEFGVEEILARDNHGNPIINDLGKPMKMKRNYLRLKDSNEVDGTIIQEIGFNKSGPYIKFPDRLKAIEMLGMFSHLNPQYDFNKQKMDLEHEKVKIQKAKLMLEIERERKLNNPDTGVSKLKERMEARKALRAEQQIDRQEINRANEREQIKKEINHVL